MARTKQAEIREGEEARRGRGMTDLEYREVCELIGRAALAQSQTIIWGIVGGVVVEIPRTRILVENASAASISDAKRRTEPAIVRWTADEAGITSARILGVQPELPDLSSDSPASEA